MEIVDYELYEIPPRWLFLQLETNAGITGWGEPLVEGRAKTVSNAVRELLENYLIGEDPLHIEDHWQAMFRGGYYRGGPVLMSAIAGIDQALWDIKGKHYDMPVYQFLRGQTREMVRVYQWVGGNKPDDVIQEATNLVEAGYTAIKMDAAEQLRPIDTPRTASEILDRVERVREVVGDDIDICIDFRGRIKKPMAKRLAPKLDAFEPMFIEEPVAPEHNNSLPEVAQETTTPLATGDRLYSRWDCRDVFEEGVLDVIQPQISHAGGISEVMRIASMAESYDIPVVLNCPLGPIAFAASLQAAVAIPNFLLLDHGCTIQGVSENMDNEYIEDPSVFAMEDGYIGPLDGPGLGITVDEEAVRQCSDQDINWQMPPQRYADGSVAGW